MSIPHQAIQPKTTIRCLIIQLARLGDTLQSLMALRAAKQLYPQLEIYFLAREKFSCAAKRIPWIKEVIVFPTDELLGPVLFEEKNETQALGDLARWIAPMVKEPWDMIINWSYSNSSSYLTGILPAKVKLGYTRRSDASFSGADGWSQYIQGIVQERVNQNIHLTDILTTQLLTALQIHAGDPVPEGNAAVTSKGFFTLNIHEKSLLNLPRNKSKKWLAIQLGASQPYKTWAPKKWAEFIKLILHKNSDYGIFLLGGKEDLQRAEEIQEAIASVSSSNSHFISLVGQTSFDLWASIISRSQWLLSGDTAAIHLASVLGTRVLNVSVGPVRFGETGPYGNGHYVITSGRACPACESQLQDGTLHECGEIISPEAVYATWSYASNEWAHRRQFSLENHFQALNWTSYLHNVRIYRSRIRSTGDGGGVLFEPANKVPLTIEEWTGMVIGQIARSWYCGWTPPVGQELDRETISPALVRMLRELRESTEVLSKICEQASKTALLLNRKSLSLKSEKIMNLADREEIQNLGQALAELEQLIDRLAKTHSPLLAFSHMCKVLMHHLKGNQLADLGKESSECYRQLSEGIAIFRSWINFTLDLVKPRKLQPVQVGSMVDPTRHPGKELSP